MSSNKSAVVVVLMAFFVSVLRLVTPQSRSLSGYDLRDCMISVARPPASTLNIFKIHFENTVVEIVPRTNVNPKSDLFVLAWGCGGKDFKDRIDKISILYRKISVNDPWSVILHYFLLDSKVHQNVFSRTILC